LRRSVYEIKKLERCTLLDFYSKLSLSITNDDPRNARDAVDLEDGKLWKKAMVEEMTTLDKNESWDLLNFLNGRNPIGRKWVFKNKLNVEGKMEKHKAQLVAKGYSRLRELILVRFYLMLPS
jgi:hypothetical protein